MYTSIIDMLVSDEEEEELKYDRKEDENGESKHHPCEDMKLSFSDRLDSILAEPSEIQGELIRKIIFYYNSTGLRMYKEYMLDLIKSDELPFYLRVECLNEMESEEEVLIMLLRSANEEMPVSMITMYGGRLLGGEYRREIVDIFKKRILLNTEVREVYKVNTIHSTREHKGIILRLSIYYVNSTKNSLYSKLQVCGNTMSLFRNNVLEEFVLAVMNDESHEDTTRGHAMDVLLRFATPEAKKKAQEYVSKLGSQFISSDAQSVHRESISENVAKLYKDVTSRIVDVSKIPEFPSAKAQLLSEYKDSDEKMDLLRDALEYVEGDHIVFGGIDRTLKSCLCLIMGFIESFGGEQRTMLYERLIEELMESVGTCSSGYLSRIANSLSGVDGYIVGISWEEQIRDNLAGRLNARMRDDPNAGDILVQMTNKELCDRTEFFRFLRENIPSIKDEMYQEFRNYMSDSDWDQFIYKAITAYYGM